QDPLRVRERHTDRGPYATLKRSQDVSGPDVGVGGVRNVERPPRPLGTVHHPGDAGVRLTPGHTPGERVYRPALDRVRGQLDVVPVPNGVGRVEGAQRGTGRSDRQIFREHVNGTGRGAVRAGFATVSGTAVGPVGAPEAAGRARCGRNVSSGLGHHDLLLIMVGWAGKDHYAAT